MPYPTRSKSQPSYADRIRQIAQRANELAEQPDFTERDVAIAIELNQRYGDVLDEMLENLSQIDTSVTVQVEGKTIRFQNEDAMSEWLAGVI